VRTSVLTRPAAIAAVMAGACAFTIIHASETAKSSITVVYNHEGAASAKGLTRRGGFSAHIDLMGRSVLFDTGGEASVILENLQSLGLGDAELEAVVISHNHWDHVYGLPGVMSSARNSPPVLVAGSAADNLKQQYPRATVIAVEGPRQIASNIWLTGTLQAEILGVPISEQALVLDHPDGLHIIAGCSHPGIVALVERATMMFPDTPIALVAGGFHLRSTGKDEIRTIAADLERLGVQKIGPSHCTGDAAVHIFRERWGDNFVSFDLGDRYRF
jgi:7,8-dihydropterin-6-yl-methyl-4-(beta-D-ribofuranosyl)aminobenzene 5'-phosphate synthase